MTYAKRLFPALIMVLTLGPAVNYRMNSALHEKHDPAGEKAAERSVYYGQGL